LRVFPLYYGFIALLVIISYALGSHWHIGIVGLLTYGIVVPHAYIWDAWWINLNHFWSLAIEEQFYLCWPLAVFALRTKRRIAYMAIAVALASFGIRCYINLSGLAHANPYLAYAWTPARLDGLLLGSALAMVVRSSLRDRALRISPTVFVLGVTVLATYGFRHGGLEEIGDPWMQTLGIFCAAVTSCAAIAATLRAGSLFARSMESSWLRFFGRYSYGLYVMHYTIATALSGTRPWIAAATHSKLIGVVGAACISLAASVGAAMLSFHCFEKPILAFKRHFQDDSRALKLRQQLDTIAPSEVA
jgi:peptidoglycan/LPS O-acetylase OafA/YrhL